MKIDGQLSKRHCHSCGKYASYYDLIICENCFNEVCSRCYNIENNFCSSCDQQKIKELN
jgi:hypothetical protein